MKTIKTTDNILFYAFRYALGRSSYAVDDVVKELISQWDNLDIISQSQIKKEVKDHLAINKDSTLDRELWEMILFLK